MFVGHLSVALAAKRLAPRVSLGWLIAGVTALDLIWPVFVLLGIERVRIVPGATAFTPFIFESYPWSHSLAMAVAWGLAYATLVRQNVGKAASTLLLVGLVVSHWVLDFVTHAPDMPLWPGSSPRLGLGLWNSIPLTIVVEGTLWIGAITLYLRAFPLGDRKSHAAFWSLVFISTVMWISGPFSPPPPTERALGWSALIGWLIIPWAALADRRRAT